MSPVSCQGKADPSETHRAVSHLSLPGDTAKDTKLGLEIVSLCLLKYRWLPGVFPSLRWVSRLDVVSATGTSNGKY